MIDMLNRFGHCINYHKVEEIKTDLATKVQETNIMTPEGIERVSGRCMGLAWDNYDENIETLSGANTLHDTVGICYQNIAPESSLYHEGSSSTVTESGTATEFKPRSKRSFVLKETVISPYRKKPKITSFVYDETQVSTPSSIKSIQAKDLIWMICSSMGRTPMWAGWNSLFTKDDLPRQRLSYMNNLSLPPTRLDVVAETLKISQKVAMECDEDFAIVHYDLAVAKPAMQIQQVESPRYDNIFICFGAFHIEMAYFGAVGFFLDGSGGPTILTDAEVLAPGSLNGFILGKHYNR